MADAIIAEGLVKQYGSVRALSGLDLQVPEGTVVNGIDVLEHPGEVRKIIGLSGQYAAVR